MTPVSLRNTVDRLLSNVFGGVFATNTKHDYYRDFGWPDGITFDQFYRMYSRNSLAAAAVDKTVAKTWEQFPQVWESEDATGESTVEESIRREFARLRVWQVFAEADRRSMVGAYSGVILRIRDGKKFEFPVDKQRLGLDGLAGVIPAWECQLTVAEWNDDPQSEGYGTPKMFQFNETPLDGKRTANRQFRVHPDRVIIWSEDGTVNGSSALEPGYNDLIDAEKVKGAGGEGFWKTARAPLRITAQDGMTPADVARNMDVAVGEVLDKINQQIDSFNQGFDRGLLLGGMTAEPIAISLPSPEHFFAAPVQCFAASMGIPLKILLGSQTGERASTEDAKEWSLTNNARRVNRCAPLIFEFVKRLERFGLLPAQDWFIQWADLTEAAVGEKLARAKDMAEVNTKAQPGDDPPFTSDEIRQAAGFDPVEVSE